MKVRKEKLVPLKQFRKIYRSNEDQNKKLTNYIRVKKLNPYLPIFILLFEFYFLVLQISKIIFL